MERMLAIITEKLESGLCDDVMETAWSTMWNVTDETPANCERFLAGGGMHLFLKCKDRFPEKADLLRNMMGLLGNVAEVPELRHKLMTREFVEEFAFLLDSHSDGIEVSYNAAGVLAHMASDGAAAWTVQQPERAFVLSRMVRAIQRWDLSSARCRAISSGFPLESVLDFLDFCFWICL
jgi:Zyg-11 family protein